ncbi:MAG: cob(I)yrinic acid a,c-diamide adenosyltransferase [Desulfuromonadales bacterium]|nr:cob(I)yrinic acid a,c-diamide adenosyltransferase [Desulfuromonadales bacterium]
MRTAKLAKGLVQIYTGNGKGKTTASLGLAFRAVGNGLRVHIMQFMKGQTLYGELESAKALAPLLSIEQVGRKDFVIPGKIDPIDVEMAQAAFARGKALVLSGDYDLVILDELNCAVDLGLIPVTDVTELIALKPLTTELVLTGRGAHPEVIALADLVTEMREIKHYYNTGQPARVGIES